MPRKQAVIIGAAQFTERVGDPDYAALSPVDITARAVRLALQDAASGDAAIQEKLKATLDTLFSVRTFEDSTPVFQSPFGRSNNFPRSVCSRLGADPARTVWGPSGGDTPQSLTAEASRLIEAGAADAVVICGGEALATTRHLKKSGIEADWHEDIEGSVDDRGASIDMLTPAEIAHGLLTPAAYYGLCENARRGVLGLTPEAWRQRMAELFAPFSRIAAHNPYSAFVENPVSVEDIVTLGSGNRMVADPYPQRLVARDRVNQSAAIVMVSAAVADQLQIPPSQRIFLHGHAAEGEPPVSERPDVSVAPSAGRAIQQALDSAEVGLKDVSLFDFYSCFPIAVSNAIEAVGIRGDDPRGLTITGGLPYFGGPGNNYSLHAIAEMVSRLRDRPGEYGLVAANGGFLSKYAVGVYSSSPNQTATHNDIPVGEPGQEAQPPATNPRGLGRVETYTLNYDRNGAVGSAVVLGRLAETGERFLARSIPDDAPMLQHLVMSDPIGLDVMVDVAEHNNFFTLPA